MKNDNNAHLIKLLQGIHKYVLLYINIPPLVLKENLERPIIKLSSHVYKNIDQLIPQRVSGNLGIVTLTCCVFQETTV